MNALTDLAHIHDQFYTLNGGIYTTETQEEKSPIDHLEKTCHIFFKNWGTGTPAMVKYEEMQNNHNHNASMRAETRSHLH